MATACATNGQEQNNKYIILLPTIGQGTARMPAEEMEGTNFDKFGVGTEPIPDDIDIPQFYLSMGI